MAHALATADGRLRVELSYKDGPVCGLDLGGESVTIGRAPRNQLSLGHPDVAKVHVRLFRGAGRFWVQPVEGIVRNNQVLDRIAEVRGGDTLEIGPYKMVLKVPEAWMELPPVDESEEDIETAPTDPPTEVIELRRTPFTRPSQGYFQRLRSAVDKLLRGRFFQGS